MKYIKQFENITSKNFWLVKTKMPDFEIALKKLKLTEFQINYFLTNTFIKKNKMKQIFIPMNYGNPTKYYDATSTEFDVSGRSPSKVRLEQDGYKYMGSVDITKQDLLDWEKENKAKKYNI